MSAKLSIQWKGPSLAVVADEVAAAKLRELLKDADDGLRRVIKCGLYIEWIASLLPHGQLMRWLETHCPDVGKMTVYRWRSLSKNMMEWAGLKFATLANLPFSADKLLDLPSAELPPLVRGAREKMDTLLDSARTPKQLFFDMGFKQGDLDGEGYPRARRGRRPGDGGRAPAPLPALTVEAIVVARQQAALRFCDRIDTLLNKLGIDFIALDDAQRGLLRATLEKTLKCIEAFEQQPKGRQSVAAIQDLWNRP